MISLCSPDRRSRLRYACLASVFSMAACASVPKTQAPTDQAKKEQPAQAKVESLPALVELPPREELPFEAREMLAARMLRHGEQMTALMVGVLLLDYEMTHALAEDLAAEPKLGRPAPNERGTLNALLPEGFFVHQDALSESARELAQAARLGNDQRIVEAFGAVAKSCVGCHSTYLHEELNMDFEHDDEPQGPPDCEAGDVCGDGQPVDPHQTRGGEAPAQGSEAL